MTCLLFDSPMRGQVCVMESLAGRTATCEMGGLGFETLQGWIYIVSMLCLSPLIHTGIM